MIEGLATGRLRKSWGRAGLPKEQLEFSINRAGARAQGRPRCKGDWLGLDVAVIGAERGEKGGGEPTVVS